MDNDYIPSRMAVNKVVPGSIVLSMHRITFGEHKPPYAILLIDYDAATKTIQFRPPIRGIGEKGYSVSDGAYGKPWRTYSMAIPAHLLKQHIYRGTYYKIDDLTYRHERFVNKKDTIK